MKVSFSLIVVFWLSSLHLQAAPVLDEPVPSGVEPARVAPNIPVGKTLLFPITASAAAGDALEYKVTSSNPNILVRAKTGNPVLRMTVSHDDGGVTDPAYTGTMDFMLFQDWLPITTGYVAGMAQSGFYNNKLFHRLADLGGGAGTTGFIFQGGDPLGTGGGGPGMTANDPQTSWKFQNEFFEGTLFTGRGQLAMANAGTSTGYSLGAGGTLQVPDYLDSNGSQFFITDGQPRHLDFKHNIFGQLLRGWDVLPKMRSTKTTSSRPDEDVKITSATIVTNETDAVLVLSAKAVGTATITVTATDPAGAKAIKTFIVTAVADTVNNNPFFKRVKPRITPVDVPSVFALEAIDLEFDYLDIQHSMLLLSASLAPKGALLAQSGRFVQMQPSSGYSGAIKVGLSIRQFDIGGGGFAAISDNTNAYVAAGDRELIGEGVTIEALPAVALTNVVTAVLRDLDIAGSPSSFTAKINWGDGTPLSSASIIRDSSSPVSNLYVALGTHTYAQAGVYPVVVSFVGDKGAKATSHSTAVVTIKAIKASGEEIDLKSARVVNRIVATFTDAAPDLAKNYTATIDWGDGLLSKGTVKRHPKTGEYRVHGTHGYKDSERFSVRVRIHKTGDVIEDDAIAWASIHPVFKAVIPHLPPFPHGKLTIAWNSGPTKFRQGLPGDDYQVTYQGTFVIINTGNKNLGASKLRFWLSRDRVLNTTGLLPDLEVKVNNLPSLSIIPFPAGGGGSGQFTLTLPKGESAGRRFLLAEAVYKSPVADSDGTEKIIVTGPLQPTIIVTPTSPAVTTEAGGKATFTVLLDTPPVNTAAEGQLRNDNVTIPLESSLAAEGAVSPSSLVFNEDNYFIPQTVTVTGLDDTADDGDKSYVIKLKAAQSADSLYNAFVGPEVTLKNLDDEPVVAVTTKPILTTTESGGSDTFKVALSRQPMTAKKTITGFTAGNPTTIASTAHGFANNAQVIISGVTGDAAPVLNATHTITVVDANSFTVPVTVTTAGTAGLVQLKPLVTIPLVSNDITEGTVSPSSLVFTAENWNVPQMVTVTGVDDGTNDGNVTYKVQAQAAVSNDPKLNGIIAAEVNVTNQDND